ncbi:HD domain-containing protein [Peribacillus kribbensis]|uniref:HD domain-containing protein n=1 Tax=Peribacillus kribbensis TaxID=356658 RepID=UPI00042197AC|nr:HD domain-containing protein [Peribacillus kribbensis]
MNKTFLLACEGFVKEQLQNDPTGHDWHHINRVRNLALRIAAEEKAESLGLIEAAALLHDIPDEKLNDSEEAGYRKLRDWLNQQGIDKETVLRLEEVIRAVPFKGGNNTAQLSFESKIVQDADRLDAIGAIGIARTFAYGGKKGHPLYNTDLPVRESMTLQEYRSGNSSTIHHFYEKLLKLKDLLHTDAARRLAEERHQFMENFLQVFYKEWNV